MTDQRDIDREMDRWAEATWKAEERGWTWLRDNLLRMVGEDLGEGQRQSKDPRSGAGRHGGTVAAFPPRVCTHDGPERHDVTCGECGMDKGHFYAV